MALLSVFSSLRSVLTAVAGRLRWLPPGAARLALGWVFLLSGWGKLRNLPDVIEFFRSLGIPAPEIQAPFASGVELVCGGMLLIGLFSRLASVPLVVVMVVAIGTARIEELTSLGALFGFVEFLYVVLLLYVAIEGPGPLSLDALLARGREAAARPGTRPLEARQIP